MLGRYRFIIALIISALGIGFCVRWKPWEPILVFQQKPLMVFAVLVLLLALAYPYVKNLWGKCQLIPMHYWLGGVMALSFIGSAVLAYGPLEGLPHVPDDICYLFQAMTFSNGELYADSHPLREFFHLLFMVNDGKWYSLFQPGWPMLLMFGVIAGVPFIINPILSTLGVFLTYKIGMRTLGEEKTRLALLLILFSPIHTSIPATLLAHTLSLVLTLAAVYLSIKMLDEKQRKLYPLLMGLIVGYLFATRAMNSVVAAAVVMPLLLHMVYKKHYTIPVMLLGLLPFLTMVSLQLAYNQHLTGDAFEWPQDRYFDTTEPKKHCHRPGFGKRVGCPNVHPGQNFPNGFTVWDALEVTHTRMGTFLLIVFGWNFLFFFVAVPFLTRRTGPWKYYLLSVFLALVIGYFAFYFHGLWGRYYFESYTMLLCLTASGIIDLHNILKDYGQKLKTYARRLLLSLMPALVVSYMLFTVFFFFFGTMNLLGQFFFGIDARLEKMLHSFPEKSIVFLERWYPTGFIFLEPNLDEKVLFVHDQGKHNRQMMQYYPDYKFFMYDPKENTARELTGDEVDTSPDRIFIEAEAKIPIMFSSGEYAFGWENEKDEYGKTISGKMLLRFEAKGRGSHVSFDQYVFEEGDYNIEVAYLLQKEGGDCVIEIEGQELTPPLPGYADKETLKNWRSNQTLHLEKGQNRITFRVTGKNKKATNYRISIDTMELILKRSE